MDHTQPDSQHPGPPIRPGEVLAGKYRVERVLGAGGMGVVVSAMHLELDQRVAVKFLHPDALENSEAAARFVREARAAVRIRSEYVARVIDVGRLENGAPYMVMEYLEGRDLSAVVERGPLPIKDAAEYIVQACDAMAEAHTCGIVHRDLKPANLFLTQRSDGAQVVKVLDFGISKLQTPELSQANLTKTTALMGSPLYMSPEQMRSTRDVDHRTDIWSLGVILYELLTGRSAFHGETLPQLLAVIMTEQPAPLQTHRPEIPAGLAAIVLRCLEKTPATRFQNVGELAAALVEFAPRRSRAIAERICKIVGAPGMEVQASLPAAPPAPAGITRNIGPVEPAARAAPGASTKSAWSETRDPAERGKTAKLIWLVAGAGVALGIASVVLFRARSAAPEPSQPATTAAVATTPTTESRKPETPTAAAPTSAIVVTPLARTPSSAAPEVSASPSAGLPTSKPERLRKAADRAAPKPRAASAESPAPTSPPPPKPPSEEKPVKRNPLAIDLK
jgi:eukaryotic-like serine/threonine-protein kinase